MNSVLITGSNGFIGKYLVNYLIKNHFVVYRIDRAHGQEILDHKAMYPNIGFIYHLAAQTDVQNSIKDPIKDAEDNILTTLHLLKMYPDAKFIYPATAASDIVKSPYGLSKRTACDYIKLLTKNYVICHLQNIFGEGGKGVVEKFVQAGDIFINGDGEQKRTFIHVEDIVKALGEAMHWPSREYFLGNDQMVKIIDLARATGKNIQYGPALSGEIQNSFMVNTAPKWKPEKDVINYIQTLCK